MRTGVDTPTALRQDAPSPGAAPNGAPGPRGAAARPLAAAAFALGSLAIIVFALGWRDTFGVLTRQYPFAAGFVKLFFLGTFGELLKRRLNTGAWALDHPLERAVIWGLFGVWFTVAFPAFAFAVDGLVERGFWPARVPGLPAWLWRAFSQSFWLNGLGMYGWGMMVTHNYLDFLVHGRWRRWSLRAYADQADTRFVLAFLPKTLLFWIAAQTFNYSLPAEWRVFVAALLAIVLGFLLGVGGRRH